MRSRTRSRRARWKRAVSHTPGSVRSPRTSRVKGGHQRAEARVPLGARADKPRQRELEEMIRQAEADEQKALEAVPARLVHHARPVEVRVTAHHPGDGRDPFEPSPQVAGAMDAEERQEILGRE